MGRVIRRVPLDFSLAINETWPGFVRPKHLELPPCAACEQLGVTLAYRWLESIGNLARWVHPDELQQLHALGVVEVPRG